jgi:hypothetical protein
VADAANGDRPWIEIATTNRVLLLLAHFGKEGVPETVIPKIHDWFCFAENPKLDSKTTMSKSGICRI